MSRVLKIILLVIVAGNLSVWAQPDIKTVSDGTVRVVSRSATKIGTGSGFIATRNGHILTNEHVVRGGHKFSVIQNGTRREISAKLVGQSRALDLAVLKISEQIGDPLEITTGLPTPGADIWAFGYPGNADRLAEQVRPTITKGVMSHVFNGSWHKSEQLRIIQHSAGISPGSSGGPLVDNCGKVIGVNSKGSGSRVLHDARGNVVDVFAGTQIYFSSHIHEAVTFLNTYGISVSSSRTACKPAPANSQIEVADIDQLRREIDATKSLAEQTGEVNQTELERLENQLDAATSLNVQQSRDISLAMQASIIAAATGILILLFMMFRSPRTKVVRVSSGAAPARAREESTFAPLTRGRFAEKKSTQFILKYSNGYDEGERRVQLDSTKGSDFVIGQHEALCDLVLDDPRLALRHARLSYGKNGAIMIEDLNSLTGTRLEGHDLKPYRAKALGMGAKFTCGKMHFQIKADTF